MKAKNILTLVICLSFIFEKAFSHPKGDTVGPPSRLPPKSMIFNQGYDLKARQQNTTTTDSVRKMILAYHTPQRILSVKIKNPDKRIGTNWAKGVCNNSTWLQGANYEWTPVLAPDDPLDNQIVGLTGITINEHSSGQEVWYTHPFGSDWNINLALDHDYDFLFAPNTPSSDNELDSAVKEANDDGLQVQNALHVEFDGGLISPYYRAKKDDEVAIFGRWIIDCGHPNFTSEIHPPLLFIKANGDYNWANGITRATIISRPFLVNQTFGGLPLRNYLFRELVNLYSHPLDPLIFPSLIWAEAYQMQARPDISRVPFTGIKLMFFTIKPQYGRISKDDQLTIRYWLGTRTGVAVQLVPYSDSLEVIVALNDASYIPGHLPPPKNVHITLSDIKKARPDISDLIAEIETVGAFSLNPFGDLVLEKGFDTDFYQLGVFVEPPLGNFVNIQNTVRANIVVDNDQVYPLIGTIELKWNRH
jgi:hypothetical protein